VLLKQVGCNLFCEVFFSQKGGLQALDVKGEAWTIEVGGCNLFLRGVFSQKGGLQALDVKGGIWCY
jgi:hypothetical protein